MFWSLIGRKCIMWLKIIRLESLYYVIFSPEANSKFPRPNSKFPWGGILNLVTSRGRKSGRKSASYNPAVTVVNRYSETGFSEVLSHLRHAHHTCENQ